MKNRIIKKYFALFILFFIIPINLTYAVETSKAEEIMNEQKSTLNIGLFIKEANEYTKQIFPDMDAKSLLGSAIKGEVDNKSIFNKVISLFRKRSNCGN